MYVVLWSCTFGAASSGMNLHPTWLENIGAAEFDKADNCFHAGTNFWPTDVKTAMDLVKFYFGLIDSI